MSKKKTDAVDSDLADRQTLVDALKAIHTSLDPTGPRDTIVKAQNALGEVIAALEGTHRR